MKHIVDIEDIDRFSGCIVAISSNRHQNDNYFSFSTNTDIKYAIIHDKIATEYGLYRDKYSYRVYGLKNRVDIISEYTLQITDLNMRLAS